MKILKTFHTAKGNYEICEDGDKKYFIKHLFTDITPELEGYEIVKPYYKVPKMLSYNKDKKEIVYEYVETLNSLTMHDALFKYENVNVNFDEVVDVLTSSFKDITLEREDNTINSKFFTGRKSFLENYLNEENTLYDKEIIVDGQSVGTFRENVKKILNNITKNKVVPCAMTQGDPTDLNMSYDGYVTDFEVAGLNSLPNEISIFVGCYLLNCYYFYIKYMNSPHAEKKDTLEKYSKYAGFEYNETENQIDVKLKNFLPPKIRALILTYLKKVKELGVLKPDFNIGSYIAMRLISPVNVNKIENISDKLMVTSLCGLFNEKYKTLDDIIEFIGGYKMNLYDNLDLTTGELTRLLKGKKYVVSISGLDNTGKSTQAKLLNEKYPDIFSAPLHINQTEAFPKLKGKELSQWWFDPQNAENFVDTMYRSIAERYEMALNSPQSIVILDKGIDFYDSRIKATLLSMGLEDAKVIDYIKKAKMKYSLINSIEDMKIIITAKDVDHIKEKNTGRDEEYLRYMNINSSLINAKINEGKTFIPVEYISEGIDEMHENIIKIIADKIKSSTQYERQYDIEKLAKHLFGDNLDLLVVAGSAGKGKFIDGWSDIDLYVVLKDESKCRNEIREFISTLNKDIHVGITFHSAREVKNNEIDNRTRNMFYEIQKDGVKPLYISKDFVLPTYKLKDVLIKDDTEKVTVLNALKRAIYYQGTSGASGRTFSGASGKECEKLLKTSILLEKILLRNLKESATKSYTDTSISFYELFKNFLEKLAEKGEKGGKLPSNVLETINNLDITSILEALGQTDPVECIKSLSSQEDDSYSVTSSVSEASSRTDYFEDFGNVKYTIEHAKSKSESVSAIHRYAEAVLNASMIIDICSEKEPEKTIEKGE